MSRIESLRPGLTPGGEIASTRLSRHTSYEAPSYPKGPSRNKTPLRQRYPNLSPTRAPQTGPDVALWPAWTKLSDVDLNLDAFDDDGHRVDAATPKGGC
jgi:hypothetical protein